MSAGRWPRKFSVGLGALLFLMSGFAQAGQYPSIPPNKDDDLTYFSAHGGQIHGVPALRLMAHKADLIIWCAGNQYVAIPDLIQAYQSAFPGNNVGVVTMPPELELAAIRAGGWHYQGKDFPGVPDVYGTVSVDALRRAQRIRQYVAYAHNELELMVKRGNPKHVTSLEDLVRKDLRVVLPNPLDEGIMKVYAKPILVRLGVWEALSGGVDCRACLRQGHVYFASVHHRDAPLRLSSDMADVALVWRTEVDEAIRVGAPLEGVHLPPEQSAKNEVTYFAGALGPGPRVDAARDFLELLIGVQGQAAYIEHGFVGIAPSERLLLTLGEEASSGQ
ncbi:MAG: substrate-binding domain-containing protein [Burkholderiaceae bacterium]|jgi:ABC-type molybdate transport system substrate-binding protein